MKSAKLPRHFVQPPAVFPIDGGIYLPPRSIPSETPAPPRPTFCVVDPPPWTEQLVHTYIRERAIRKLAIPLIFDLGNFAGSFIIKDIDLAIYSLLLTDAFDNVASTEVHADGVSRRGDFVVKTLNLGESGLQTVPLRLVLLAAFCFCNGIFEDPLIIP